MARGIALGVGGRLTLACLAALAAGGNAFAAPEVPSGPAILQELKKFASTGRVLMVAAHPDDENTQLITYLARGRNYRMAYLSVTRGDGGQNVLGPEFGDELGWIRTQELLAARRLDGGEQFFTRARDFGFSKSAAETLKIWDKPAVLGDVVRVIRTFQPDVIITRFSPTQGNTHGHHTASAILALEAFKLAADPNAYPEQLTTLKVWQAERILQNSGGPNGGGGGSVHIEVGGDDPVLGMSYGEIAGKSRAMHKSQGFGNFGGGRGGARTESFTLLDGEPTTTDIMDGVDTTWTRFPGISDIDPKIAEVISKFDPKNPAASVEGLIGIKKAIRALPVHPIIEEKAALLDTVIQNCLGITVKASIENAMVIPGDEATLVCTIAAQSELPILTGISASAGAAEAKKSLHDHLSPNSVPIVELKVSVAKDHPPTQPYWLSLPPDTGIYTVANPGLIGRPENPPAIPITVSFDVAGEEIRVRTEPLQREDGRRAEVIAPVSLAFPFDVKLFKPGVAREVEVEVTGHRAGAQGTAKLAAADRWKVEPTERAFEISAAGEKKTVTFTVTPPSGAGSADLQASADVDGRTYNTGWKEIKYGHIPPLLMQPPVSLRAVSMDLATAGHEIGYLPGAGDSVAECLKEMGYAVTILTLDDLDPDKLKKFDAVVIGVRAFNVRPDLAQKAKGLFAYAEAGGTVVEQYNRPDRLDNVQLAPYSLRLSGLRITDETAEMKFLAPEHRVLNMPNKITSADFDGWVQERGIYFPTQWDEHWIPILGGSDPGEQPLDGGLLIAQHGKGYFVYTGLVFFRELPAGVPGAYRLMANLVSLGKN